MQQLEPQDDEVFLDGENIPQSNEGSVTYGQLVLSAIRKCMEQGSKEMKGGYYKEKHTTKGTMEIYVENQAEIYINSVKSFYDLMIRYFYEEEKDKKVYDKEFADAEDLFETTLEEIDNEAIELLKKRLEFTDDERVKKVIEYQIATKYLDPESFEAKRAADKKLEAYRFLYQQLILLYGRSPLGTDMNIYA